MMHAVGAIYNTGYNVLSAGLSKGLSIAGRSGREREEEEVDDVSDGEKDRPVNANDYDPNNTNDRPSNDNTTAVTKKDDYRPPKRQEPQLPLEIVQSLRRTPIQTAVSLSQISASPTLLPDNLAKLITAVSLAARVSLRASALFIEAMLESAKYGTSTSLGLTRRALITAVGSARAVHYIKGGLDWGGRDAHGVPTK